MWDIAGRLIVLAATQFVVLHGTSGQEVFINPAQITTLREPIGDDRRHFPQTTHCVIVTASGKFVTVQEMCSEVSDRIAALNRPR